MASSNALVLGVLLAINMALPTLATVYTVGDTSGWAVGADYSTWTSDKTFAVGDTLVFNYGGGHTVDEVKESDYKSCTVGNSISTDSSGATKIALKTAGTHYFICSIPGHCAGGMKLAVTVKPTSTSATGKPSSPSATTTAPKSNSSSANTLSHLPIVAVLIVSWISYYVLRLL